MEVLVGKGAEMIFAALAEAVIGIVIEDLAGRDKLLGMDMARLRDRLRGGSPQELALESAFTQAYLHCKQHNAQFDLNLLVGYLRDPAVHAELAKLLLIDEQPDRDRLVNVWKSGYFTTRAFDIEGFLGCFLPQAEDRIKKEPVLKPFADSKALDQLYTIADTNAEQVELQRQMLAELRKQTLVGESTPPPATYTVTGIFARQPNEIPDQPGKLFGRETLQTEVEAALNGGKHVLLLQGFGGMGKTALAATLAAKWVRVTGPVLWIKAGQAAADVLLEGLARPFGAEKAMAAAQGDAKIDVLRAILARSGATLLVIDDAWEGDALAPVLKSIPADLPVLLTSRIRHAVGEIKTVGELDPAAALNLLEQHAGIAYAGDADAARLCDTLGYHAFTIEIAGRTLQVDQLTPAELLRQVENAPHALAVPNELALEGRRRVADLIEVSLNALQAKGEDGQLAYDVFLAFGAFFASSATPELLELYMQSSPTTQTPAVASALTTLARRGLAERLPSTDNAVAYFRIHDLAYSYARAQNTDEHRHRAVAACLNYTQKYNTPSLENFAALRPEIDNFIGAALFAFESNRYETGRQFAANLTTRVGSHVLDFLGFYTQTIVLHANALTVTRRAGNRADECASLSILGIAFANLGQYTQAIDHFQQALVISREISDRRIECGGLGNLGNVYFSLGQYAQAIDYHQQALVISREIGDRHGEGVHLDNLGSTYASLGQYAQAIDYHQQALVISREIGDRRGEGSDQGNLGVDHRNLGQYAQAIDHHQQALVISREIGDRHGEGVHLGNLGTTYKDLRQYAQAIDSYQQALAIAREIGDRHGEGVHLGNLGTIYKHLRHYEQAIDYYQQARAIFEALGLAHLIEQTDHNIALAQAALAGEESEDGEADSDAED